MTPRRFQIRGDAFGVAVETALSPTEALVEFAAARSKAGLRDLIEVDADGAPSITLRGIRYTAVEIPG